MYVELKSIQEEIAKMDIEETLPRSCQDIEVHYDVCVQMPYIVQY